MKHFFRFTKVMAILAAIIAGGFNASARADYELLGGPGGGNLEDELVYDDEEPVLADVGGGAGYAGGAGSAAPYMLGDTNFGGCGSLTVQGLNAVIGHPLFGCSRLNLAENGTPIPVDRAFIAYRHFDGPTFTDIFSDALINNRRSLDVDRVTFGLERTMFNGRASVEIRVPFNYQLTPTIEFSDVMGTSTGVPVDNRDFEFGNVALAFKSLLYESCTTAVAGGFGLSLPTARDVTIDADLTNTPLAGIGPVSAQIRSLIANETVYITPYIGAVYNPGGPNFAQGFLQVDVPLNETRATLGITGDINFADSASLSWQSLMRLNAQVGRWIYDNRGCGGYIDRVAVTLEGNWTTTLNDAKTIGPINLDPGGTDVMLNLGNPANQVDIVDAGAGIVVEMGYSYLHVGGVLPISTGDNQPFNWEGIATWNRRF